MPVRCVILLLAAGAALAQGPAGPDPNASTVWVNRPKPGSLPAGVTHHTYRSESMGREVGYLIYLPPHYQQEPQRRYPVIYNLHGAGGNELHGQLAAEILHEGILAKRWPPMILVMPNGGKYTFHKDSADGRYRGETTIHELIPHIDQTYRTIAAREGRAIWQCAPHLRAVRSREARSVSEQLPWERAPALRRKRYVPVATGERGEDPPHAESFRRAASGRR